VRHSATFLFASILPVSYPWWVRFLRMNAFYKAVVGTVFIACALSMLSGCGGNATVPAASSLGSPRILYVVGIQGTEQIHSANLNGTGDKIVSQFTPASNTSGCTFSHDGKLMVYQSNTAGNQMTISNVDGSNAVTYSVPSGYYMYAVDFSPDDSKLAVAGGDNNNSTSMSFSALVNPSTGAQIGSIMYNVSFQNWFYDSTRMLALTSSGPYEILNTSTGVTSPSAFPPLVTCFGFVAPDNTMVLGEGNLGSNGNGPTAIHSINAVTGVDKILATLPGAYQTLGYTSNYSTTFTVLAPVLPTQNLQFCMVSKAGAVSNLFTVPNGVQTMPLGSQMCIP